MTDDIFDDYPAFTPGQIGYGTLRRIIEWQERHGLGEPNIQRKVDAYREDGYSAAQAGLELGLIDYPQATGCELPGGEYGDS